MSKIGLNYSFTIIVWFSYQDYTGLIKWIGVFTLFACSGIVLELCVCSGIFFFGTVFNSLLNSLMFMESF